MDQCKLLDVKIKKLTRDFNMYTAIHRKRQTKERKWIKSYTCVTAT